MKQRIVGLDLNGRYDMAARDWGSGVEAAGGAQTVHGGACSVVVTMGHADSVRLVAGPQAAWAPHGRGGGWGEIGEPARRRPLAKTLDRAARDPGDAADLRAAVDALASGGEDVIVAVPDLARFAEAQQGTLIAAMSARGRRVRLLWRSVAVFLDLLYDGQIGPDWEGAPVRLLVHTGQGLEDQLLTLRADPEREGHYAPQREGPGRLCAESIGLDALFDAAQRAVLDHNPHIDWRRGDVSLLGPGLLTGQQPPGGVEVLRTWDGQWHEILPPALSPQGLGLDRVRVARGSVDVKATFLVTPLSVPLASALAQAIARQVGVVTALNPETVARGCLRAGRLIEQGLPHYFDKLEPVSIAVLRGDEPAFEPLIPPGHIVPANREYVSRELSNFKWGRGKPEIDFYVCKGEEEVRHWRVTKEDGPLEDVGVHLRIRQTPGQSWARLTVSSREWEPLSRMPIALDWDALTPLDLTPEKVLGTLRVKLPAIPERIVQSSHLDLWIGSRWGGAGQAERLALRGNASPSQWNRLLKGVRTTPSGERVWLVGTDGDLPPQLPAHVRDGFLKMVEQWADQVCAATLDQPLEDNELLLALTWCFTLCPGRVQDAILDALEEDALGQWHGLSWPRGAISVLRYGAGRAVHGVERLKRLFRYLAQTELNTVTLSALALALTRREEAADALTREQVEQFFRMLAQELIETIAKGNYKVRFQNTLSAIAGLFCWRRHDRWALIVDRDPVATEMRETLLEAKHMMEQSAISDVQKDRKIAQIDAIIEYLEGGGDPDILRTIEAIDE